MQLTFFNFDLDELPIVIKDIMDNQLFVVPVNIWKRHGLDAIVSFLSDSGLTECGANAFQDDKFVGTTEI